MTIEENRKELEDRVDLSQKKGKLAHKESYSQFDFQEVFEKVRFSTTYRVYKMMDWWPLIDFLA